MKPRGIRLNNPLNIRHNRNNRWQGVYEQQDDPSFVHFASMQFGIRAAFIILRGYITKGLNTPKKIITRWAPPKENPTTKYVQYVCIRSGLHPDNPIMFSNKGAMVRLVEAMIYFENGWEVKKDIIEQGYEMV